MDHGGIVHSGLIMALSVARGVTMLGCSRHGVDFGAKQIGPAIDFDFFNSMF